MGKFTEIMAWPAVVLVLGLAFLLIQRISIADFIRRTKVVKGFGGAVDASPAAEAQAEAEAPKTALPPASHVEDESFLPPLLKEATAAILADPRLTSLPNDAARVKILARHLAASQAAVFFEFIYRLIFHSQIIAIREANATGGITLERARQLYDAAAAKAPATYAILAFEGWLHFISENSRLVVGNPNGRLYATMRGQEFLRYLPTRNYDDKHYTP